MANLSPASLLDSLTWRYATKKFDPTQKVPADLWNALEQSLVLTPSSFGLQPWRFVVIEDAGLKSSLTEASWGQSQVRDCSHHLVFLVRSDFDEKDVDRFLERSSEVRGVDVITFASYRDLMVGFLKQAKEGGYLKLWLHRQVYIALGQFMASAAMLGVDTCPMEGIDPGAYDRLLAVDTTQWSTVCACAVGYRAKDDKYASLPKVRFPLNEVIEYRS